MPVYLATQGAEVAPMWPEVLAATVGAVIGTLAGGPLLKRIPERWYRPLVGSLILLLGVYMLWRAAQT